MRTALPLVDALAQAVKLETARGSHGRFFFVTMIPSRHFPDPGRDQPSAWAGTPGPGAGWRRMPARSPASTPALADGGAAGRRRRHAAGGAGDCRAPMSRSASRLADLPLIAQHRERAFSYVQGRGRCRVRQRDFAAQPEPALGSRGRPGAAGRRHRRRAHRRRRQEHARQRQRGRAASWRRTWRNTWSKNSRCWCARRRCANSRRSVSDPARRPGAPVQAHRTAGKRPQEGGLK